MRYQTLFSFFYLLKKEAALIGFLGLIILNGVAVSKDNYTFELKNAAFFRLVSSGFSADDVDMYCLFLESELESATGWQIMDYRSTTEEIKKQGGDWLCSKVDCATLNGQYLNVDYVIFGRVQTIGLSVSITVQIADVSTGRLVSDVTKFYSGKRSKFTKVALPEVVELVASDIKTIAIARQKRNSAPTKSVNSIIKSRKQSSSFNDMRGYLSYSEDTTSRIVTDGKMAFGYLMIGANMSSDDVLRYSYQLQSYLSLAGAHAMLYIDEMELLMQVRGGDLRCASKKGAKEIGRLLGVDFMGYGKISRLYRYFWIKTSIVDVENGNNVKRAVKIYRGSEDVFLTDVIPDIAAQLGDAFESRKKKTKTLQSESAQYSF